MTATPWPRLPPHAASSPLASTTGSSGSAAHSRYPTRSPPAAPGGGSTGPRCPRSTGTASSRADYKQSPRRDRDRTTCSLGEDRRCPQQSCRTFRQSSAHQSRRPPLPTPDSWSGSTDPSGRSTEESTLTSCATPPQLGREGVSQSQRGAEDAGPQLG